MSAITTGHEESAATKAVDFSMEDLLQRLLKIIL
jgi:hypothetical protein